MSNPQPIDLTPAGAAERIQAELALARRAVAAPRSHAAPDLDTALDAYVRALGLALQLGPAPSEHVLADVLDTARLLAEREDAAGLSALGPAVVDLVAQVRAAGALPPTAVMEAWADVTAELGALVGQIGLALALPPDRHQGMLDNARARAALIDDATSDLFALTPWLAQL